MPKFITLFRKPILSLITLLTLLVLSGCNASQNQAQQSPNQTSPSAGQAATLQTAYPFTYTDAEGNQTVFPKKPERIVSLVPSCTETLSALGLEDQLVAATIYDNYPTDIQDKVGYLFEDALNPNAEQLLKLNPDLVILGIQDEKTVESIRKLNIPIVRVDPQSLEATYTSIEKLGQLTDTQEQAKKIIDGMKLKEKQIADKISTIKENQRLKVWIEVDPTLFTAGDGTFLNELLTKAGGVNVANDVKGWGQYSVEQIVDKNPQVILETYSYYVPNVKETILARSGWQSIEAIKNQKVFSLDNDIISRPGPRIVDGLESIAKAIYPELFK